MKLAVMFPGQGSQFAGMGAELVRDAEARETFDQADEILGFDLLSACLDRNDELSVGAIAQPAILAYSVAAWRVTQARSGVTPIAAAGHSLGEIAALVCAEALSFATAIGLAQERGRLMASCAPGKLAVVFGLHADDVAAICAQVRAGRVCVGNRNAQAQCVITGDVAAVDEAAVVLTERRAIVRPLRVTAAAHSPLMEPIVEQFRALVLDAGIRDATIPVVSSITGRARRSAAELSAGLCGQLTSTVDWPQTIDGLTRAGADTFLDTGPKSTLRDLVLLDAPSLAVLACGARGALGDVCAELAARAGGEGAGAYSLTPYGISPYAHTAPLTSEGEVEALVRLLRVVVSTPTTVQVDGETYDSAIRSPHDRLRELLRGAREPSGAPRPLARGIPETYSVLQAKGQSAAEARDSLARALDGLMSGADIDASLQVTVR